MTEPNNKTQPATPRRLAEAFRAAHVPTSQVLTRVAGLVGCLTVCAAGAGWAVFRVVALMRGSLQRAFERGAFDERRGPAGLEAAKLVLVLLGPVLLSAWVLSLSTALVQSRGRLRLPGREHRAHTPGRAMPAVVLVSSLAVGAAVVWSQRGSIVRVGESNAAALLSQAGALTLQLLLTLGCAWLLLGTVDLLWQRWRWRQSLRMSYAELDQEARLTFGDPALRRERQRLSQVLLKKPEPSEPANP